MEGLESRSSGFLRNADAACRGPRNAPSPRQRDVRAPCAIGKRHLAALGELDGVADQVEQDLLQPLRVGDHPVGDIGIEVELERQALCLRRCRGTERDHRRRHACSEPAMRPDSACRLRSSSGRARRSGSPSATSPTMPRSAPDCAAACRGRVPQQIQRAQHAVHRRADLMAHRRQELRLRQLAASAASLAAAAAHSRRLPPGCAG